MPAIKPLSACDAYLGREAKSEKGKIRQGIVKRVRQLAVDDRVGFVKYMKTPDEGKRFGTILEVLTESRRRTLKLVDHNEKDLQHVGGAASYLAKIESGMLEGKTNLMTNDPEYLTNREYHEFVDKILAIKTSMNAVEANMKHPLKNGESLNLSGRNVAASRLAELLGLGDLVAKSETAVLENSDGGKIVGNLMQEAKGKEVQSYLIEQRRDQYREQTENLDMSGQKGADDMVTPEFLQSLISL